MASGAASGIFRWPANQVRWIVCEATSASFIRRADESRLPSRSTIFRRPIIPLTTRATSSSRNLLGCCWKAWRRIELKRTAAGASRSENPQLAPDRPSAQAQSCCGQDQCATRRLRYKCPGLALTKVVPPPRAISVTQGVDRLHLGVESNQEKANLIIDVSGIEISIIAAG